MVAVEFDTFQNNEYGDPNNNHIAITTDGEDGVPVSLATQSSPGLDLVGQRWVWIDYVDSQLRVFISSNNTKPNSPVLTHDVGIANLL
jgi:Legume lectin domain